MGITTPPAPAAPEAEPSNGGVSPMKVTVPSLFTRNSCSFEEAKKSLTSTYRYLLSWLSDSSSVSPSDVYTIDVPFTGVSEPFVSILKLLIAKLNGLVMSRYLSSFVIWFQHAAPAFVGSVSMCVTSPCRVTLNVDAVLWNGSEACSFVTVRMLFRCVYAMPYGVSSDGCVATGPGVPSGPIRNVSSRPLPPPANRSLTVSTLPVLSNTICAGRPFAGSLVGRTDPGIGVSSPCEPIRYPEMLAEPVSEFIT